MNNEKHLNWKLIKGSNNIYISNFGDVKSGTGFIYSPFVDTTGYKKINITIDGKQKQEYIHRLVAIYFVENPFNKPEVNHKNGDKHNNCQWNLEWCTEEENILHKKYVLNKSNEGENNPMFGRSGKRNSRYKDQIYAIKEDGTYTEYSTQTEAAIKLFGNKNIANQISRALSHKRNCLIVHGYYFLYKAEYDLITQADLKPRELLEHPNLMIKHYRGQSAAKPQKYEEGSTTIEKVTNLVELNSSEFEARGSLK